MTTKLTLSIEQDLDAENPRDWDNLGTMVCWHRRYKLGDEQPREDLENYFEGLGEEEKDYFSLPLYLYEHGGITMNTIGFSCPWDSGQVGVIYVTREKILKECGGKYVTKKKLEKALNCLKGEVETYDQYLTGDVWGYVVEDEDGNDVSSCWGFFGRDWAEKEGEAARENMEKKIAARELEEAMEEAKERELIRQAGFYYYA